MRIYQIAKALGLYSQDVIEDMRRLNIDSDVRSPADRVPPIFAATYIAFRRGTL